MTCQNFITKPCSTCGEVKLLSEFSPDKKMKLGARCYCKKCAVIAAEKHQRTKNGLIYRMRNSQFANSKSRDHRPPPYSLEELREWCLAQPIFHELYDKWVESSYDKWMKPSCDRTDDSKGYSLDRLTIMTWRENMEKAGRDEISGVLNRGAKTVTQMNRDGSFVKEWHSAAQAGRETGCKKNIDACCRDEQKTAGGYKWAYSNPIHNDGVNHD